MAVCLPVFGWGQLSVPGGGCRPPPPALREASHHMLLAFLWASRSESLKAHLTAAGHPGSLWFFLTNGKPCDLEALVISAKPILRYNVLRSPEHHPTHLQVVPTCRAGVQQGVYSPVPTTGLHTCLSVRFVIE